MSVFSDILAADAAGPFLDEFGEDVLWIPRTGPQRTIRALVTRNAPAKDGATPRQLAAANEIAISKIAVPTLPVEGGDKVKLADVAQPFTVVDVHNGTDPGMWYLAIE